MSVLSWQIVNKAGPIAFPGSGVSLILHRFLGIVVVGGWGNTLCSVVEKNMAYFL